MSYYKSQDNSPYFDPSPAIIARDGLTEISKEQFDALVEELNVPATLNTTTITKLQLVEWCEANEMLDTLVDILNSDAILKFKWDAATSLAVDHPLILGAAPLLGIDDVQAVFNDIGGTA